MKACMVFGESEVAEITFGKTTSTWWSITGMFYQREASW